MKKLFFNVLLILLISFSFNNCKKTTPQISEKKPDTYVRDNYTKQEVTITMRDSIKLHTTIYSPKDNSKEYPILLLRTPYSCRPYGEDKFPKKISPNVHLMKEGKHSCISRCKRTLDE